ncbi:MAG: BrnT family toxin [Bryobacteraceae bacterium]|nr:BrnT family toxin [Bryobacteraceae bacterium]
MGSISPWRRSMFTDPHVTLREDRIDETGERRWHALGLAAGLEPILLVVHVYREANDGEEIVRIISARKARKSERRAYLQ